MNPIVKFVVAALLLTGSALGFMAPTVSDTPAATPSADVSAETTEKLTAAEAIAIALEDAGLAEAEVTELRTHYEVDDRIPEWDVDFRCGDWEYDYTVHAETGAILERDKDYAPKKTATEPAPTDPPVTEPAPTDPPATEPAPTDPPATEPAPTDPPATEPPAQEPVLLTREEALSIALEDAGLTEAEVTELRTHYEVDDRIPEWDVDFRCGDWEYDYTVHAETGAILERDKDYAPKKTATEPAPTDPPATEPAPTDPPVTEPPAQEPVLLTREEALSIALEDAGLTEAEVTELRTHYEVDDRIPEWDVDFRCGDWEYDYTVHAETGAILERDKDYAPKKTATEPAPTDPPATEPAPTDPPATEPPAQEPVLLTREEALSIALEHAGLTEDQIRGLDVEFDSERSGPEWSIEFRFDGWEFEYEIHAETGAILEWDKEFDD